MQNLKTPYQIPNKRQIDSSYIKSYLRNGLLMQKESDYQIIKQETDKTLASKQQSIKSIDEALENFEQELKKATYSCLPKCEKIAVELSGGLDSSCIASLVREQLPKHQILALTHAIPAQMPKWFQSLSGAEKKLYTSSLHDELKWSHQVSEHLGLQQYLVNKEEDLHWIIETSCKILGEPSEILFPLLNLPLLKQAQSLGVKTILSGFGGDEVVSQSGNLYISELKQNKNYLKYVYEKFRSFQFNKKKNRVFEENYEEYLSEEVLKTSKINYKKPKTIASREYQFIEGDLSFHLNKRVEISKNLAKHFGIKYQFPLLDTKLLQFFHNLPSHFKYQHGKNRFIMRKYLEKKVPTSVAWRKDKAGCTAPAGRFYLIHNLPKVFLERIDNNYQGVLCQFLQIKKLRNRLEKGPIFCSKFLRILVFSLMLEQLEKKHGKL